MGDREFTYKSCKVVFVKKNIRKLLFFLLMLVIVQPFYFLDAKEKVERYVEGEAGCFRRRTKFGVLASKVKDVKKGTNDAYQATSVFVSQKKGVIE